MAADVVRNPVAEYTDPRRLAEEKAQLFRGYPLVVGHGSQCAEPRDFFTEDVAGVPVLVSRQDDGSLKAFLNVCRHRGSKVTFEECGQRRSFTCPYHAWTYRSDGVLTGIPYGEGFEGLDRAGDGPGLAPVGGAPRVRVGRARGRAVPDVARPPGRARRRAGEHGLAPYVVELGTVLRADFNWKVVVDGFLETYHLRFLHNATIGPYIKTNVAPFEAVGRHGRMVAVRNGYDEVRGRLGEEAAFLPYVAVVYQIFPNTIILWQGDHFESWFVFPEGEDPARSASRVQLLAPRPTASDDEQRHWDQNWKVLMDTVLNEDFVVARAAEEGFATGAQTHLTFGRNEPALQHYHRSLSEVLGPVWRAEASNRERQIGSVTCVRSSSSRPAGRRSASGGARCRPTRPTCSARADGGAAARGVEPGDGRPGRGRLHQQGRRPGHEHHPHGVAVPRRPRARGRVHGRFAVRLVASTRSTWPTASSPRARRTWCWPAAWRT